MGHIDGPFASPEVCGLPFGCMEFLSGNFDAACLGGESGLSVAIIYCGGFGGKR
jgi:hypothetical protein